MFFRVLQSNERNLIGFPVKESGYFRVTLNPVRITGNIDATVDVQ